VARALTCSAYERDVTACVRFLGEQGIGDLRSVRPRDLRRFLANEAERRPALGSQARTVAALKGVFRFLVENEASSATRRSCCGRRRSMRR